MRTSPAPNTLPTQREVALYQKAIEMAFFFGVDPEVRAYWDDVYHIMHAVARHGAREVRA